MINKKILNLASALNKMGLKKEALEVCSLSKKAFTSILPFLIGCRKDQVIPGEFELFSLSNPIDREHAESLIDFEDYDEDQVEDIKNFLESSSLRKYFREERVFSEFELGEFYKYEEEGIEADWSVKDVIGYIDFKVQFSCIPMASEIFYTIKGEKIIFREKEAYYGMKVTPYHINDEHALKSLKRHQNTSAEYEYDYESESLKEEKDTIAIVANFTYLYIKETNYVIFNGISVAHPMAKSRCDLNYIPKSNESPI